MLSSQGKFRTKFQKSIDKIFILSAILEQNLSNPQVLLSDMVINYSLLLLHKQFPDALDLEDTELGIWKKFSK